MITLDGSQGEGGGQILRTALALSLCTGRGFAIKDVRGKRAKPGLLRQHLTAVHAAEQVGKATLSGDEIGSRELIFQPQTVRPGTYTFSVGTAGSAVLVLQTVLPALLTASGPSKLTCRGGTLNPFAPPFDFLSRAFEPQIRRMGPRLHLMLNQAGFYPAGGGEFCAHIDPAPELKPLSLLEKGEFKFHRGTIYLANLMQYIAVEEIHHLQKLLSWPEKSFQVFTFQNNPGTGNAILLEESHQHINEVFIGIGEKGVPSAQVAQTAVNALRRHQISGAVVGEYLADQLLIPLALAGAGEFITSEPSSHTLTNAQTIAKFLEVKIDFLQDGETTWRCVVGG